MSGRPKWRQDDDAYWLVYAYVMKRSTANAGWTRDCLAGWNVEWPPPRGWKDRLIRDVIAQAPERRVWSESQIAEVIGRYPQQSAIEWVEGG